MKNLNKIFAAFALAAAVGGASASFAQQEKGAPNRQERRGGRPDAPFGGGGLFHPGMFRQLDLTIEQQAQIQKLHQASRAESETRFAQVREADEQLRAVVQTGNFNEDQARQILTRKSAAQIELEIGGLRTDAAIFALLTAEQKSKLEPLRGQRPERPHRGEFRPDAAPPQN